MRAVITFESIYGNTRAVAEAVAAGLSSAGEVSVVSHHEADPAVVADADLVVVGAPTHMHGLPTSFSRKMAAQLPNATLVECEGAGHMVIFEARARVNEALDALVEAASS